MSKYIIKFINLENLKRHLVWDGVEVKHYTVLEAPRVFAPNELTNGSRWNTLADTFAQYLSVLVASKSSISKVIFIHNFTIVFHKSSHPKMHTDQNKRKNNVTMSETYMLQ